MSETLEVKIRESRGSRAARRERADGLVPAVLYGHGEDVVCLTAAVEDVDAIIRHGSRILNLKGGVTENALLKDVQWDAFGLNVVHLDLTRVSKGEKVQVTIPIELHGTAPGAAQQGVVDQVLHEIEIECLMSKVIEKIEVNINDLQLNGSIAISELEVPEGVSFLVDDEAATVVQCVEATPASGDDEEEGAAAVGGEPEVIGESSDEEE